MLTFPPAVWGPFFWHTIHIVALAYPSDPTYSDKKAAKEFFESLQHLLPCPVCRSHYIEHIKKYSITPHLDRRKDLFRWTVLLHNTVNLALQKPTVEEKEVLAYYTRLGKRNRSPVWTPDDILEADMAATLRGIGYGTLGTSCLVGVLYVLSTAK